jgi:hypothetical protein
MLKRYCGILTSRCDGWWYQLTCSRNVLCLHVFDGTSMVGVRLLESIVDSDGTPELVEIAMLYTKSGVRIIQYISKATARLVQNVSLDGEYACSIVHLQMKVVTSHQTTQA